MKIHYDMRFMRVTLVGIALIAIALALVLNDKANAMNLDKLPPTPLEGNADPNLKHSSGEFEGGIISLGANTTESITKEYKNAYPHERYFQEKSAGKELNSQSSESVY